jgi:hypothetical protein
MYWGNVLKSFYLENLYIHDIVPPAPYVGDFGSVMKGYGIRIAVVSNYRGYV